MKKLIVIQPNLWSSGRREEDERGLKRVNTQNPSFSETPVKARDCLSM